MEKLVVARIGARWTGFLTGDLREVVPMPRLFPLPESLPHITGTAFIGGSLVTVVNPSSLAGEAGAESPPDLLLRLAPPNSNLGFPVAAVEAVLPFDALTLREEDASGIWAGLYPWGENWINVWNSSAVAEQVTRATSTALHTHSSERSHVS